MESTEFHVPFRYLLRSQVADLLTDELVQAISEESGATLQVSHDEAMIAADSLISVLGNAGSQAQGCRLLVQKLRLAQGVAEGAKHALVVVVPKSSAAAVVGVKGQRVRELIDRSGALIDISREVVAGLSAQPVTITGTLEQVITGVIGVHEVLQELVERGRLGPRDFPLPELQVAAGMGAESVGPDDAISSVAASMCIHDSVACVTPLQLIVPMDAAGRVIGKRGRRITDLQRSTGCKLDVVNAGVPGMRCGDRLLEITSDTAEQRERALRAVMNAMAEDPPVILRELLLLIPVNTVGFIIGKGGQTVKEIMHNHDVVISMGDDDPTSSLAARPITISGGAGLEAWVESILAVLAKTDEIQGRPSTRTLDNVRLQQRWPSSDTDVKRAQTDIALGTPSCGTVTQCSPEPSEAAEIRSARSSFQPTLVPNNASMWPSQTPSERAVLAGIQATGVLDHRLTLRVPQSLLAHLDIGDVIRRSGAKLELSGADSAPLPQAAPWRAHSPPEAGYIFITVIGQRMSTCLATLYLQEELARLNLDGKCAT